MQRQTQREGGWAAAQRLDEDVACSVTTRAWRLTTMTGQGVVEAARRGHGEPATARVRVQARSDPLRQTREGVARMLGGHRRAVTLCGDGERARTLLMSRECKRPTTLLWFYSFFSANGTNSSNTNRIWTSLMFSALQDNNRLIFSHAIEWIIVIWWIMLNEHKKYTILRGVSDRLDNKLHILHCRIQMRIRAIQHFRWKKNQNYVHIHIFRNKPMLPL